MLQLLLGGLIVLFIAYFLAHSHKVGFRYFGIHESDFSMTKLLVIVSIAFVILCVLYVFLKR